MRKAKPWYRRERDCWCVYIKGKLVVLARGKVNRKQAVQEWHRVMADDRPQPDSITVRQLFDRYDEAHRTKHQPHTTANRQTAFRSFGQSFGAVKASAIKPRHVEEWKDRHPDWSSTTVWTYLGYLRSAYRWAERQGLLLHNPLKNMDRPTPKSRGADCTITDEQHRLMIEKASPALRLFLTALRETGARPGEVASVTAQDFDAELGIWVVKKHKTAHLGKQRVVFLTPGVVEMCKTLVQQRPEGPLFRTGIGTAWTPSGVHAALDRLAKRCGFKQRPIAYGYRHGFATDALTSGVPDAQVAELLGHSSTAMLHRHYAHLGQRTQVLRSALNRVR